MGKKILLIEDELAQVEILKMRLEAKGYRFIAAMDGKSGLRKVYDEKPDLVLLDILLPKISGEEICHQIRANPESRYMPIIIITALEAEELRKRCIVVGATDWVNKPYDFSDLLQKIENALKD